MSARNPMPLRPMRDLDDLLDAGEGAAANEEDVRGVDLDELLVGVLAPTLRRHRGGGALQDLEQRLLHAFARHVAGDRRVLALAGDLVDLVDVDDPCLGLFDVVVGRLDQLEENVLDVLADVASLGERGGIGDGEGNVEHARQCLREVGLAAAGGADQQDVRLGQLDLGVVVAARLHALVMAVDGDRQDLLGVLLADHIVVQELVDLFGFGQLVEPHLGGISQLLLDDVVAQFDALIADVDTRSRNELANLLLRLTAEAALDEVAATVSQSSHPLSPAPQATPAATGMLAASRVVITSSTMP